MAVKDLDLFSSRVANQRTEGLLFRLFMTRAIACTCQCELKGQTFHHLLAYKEPHLVAIQGIFLCRNYICFSDEKRSITISSSPGRKFITVLDPISIVKKRNLKHHV